MWLFYYDEVKNDPTSQTSYLLGGIGLQVADARPVERKISEIAEDVFGTGLLERGHEFHGIEIVQGKAAFKGVDLHSRCELLTRLLAVVREYDIARFFVRINPKNIVATEDPPEEIAFKFMVEKVQSFLVGKDDLGMLFGDYDAPRVGPSVKSLSSFRRNGTSWRMGREIDNLVDTVHFCQSHHSRLMQLADVWLYCSQFAAGNNAAPWRQKVLEAIRVVDVLFPTFYKDWPREPHWYR